MNEANKYNWKVCVRCSTFNHAHYIVDAMNGFTMQQTSFPYVCCIIDDASTDGEPEIIQRYLETYFDMENNGIFRQTETKDFHLIYARHKTNQNCYFAVFYLKYNHHKIKKSSMPYIAEWIGKYKYIAICEGDDYWTHSSKLQIQAELMDNHDRIAMCTHAFATVTTNRNVITTIHALQDNGLLDVGLVIENVQAPHTSSFFYRSKDFYMSPHFFYETGVGDYTRRVYSAINGGIYYINTEMSHYRKFANGSWTSLMRQNVDAFLDHVNKMIIFAKNLDSLTNGVYHKNIENRIDYCMFLMNIKRGKMKNATNTNYFKSKSMIGKIKLIIHHKYPQLYYNITVLYKMIH